MARTHAWMAGALETMDAVFRPIVKTLNAADLPPEDDVARSDAMGMTDDVGGNNDI